MEYKLKKSIVYVFLPRLPYSRHFYRKLNVFGNQKAEKSPTDYRPFNRKDFERRKHQRHDDDDDDLDDLDDFDEEDDWDEDEYDDEEEDDDLEDDWEDED